MAGIAQRHSLPQFDPEARAVADRITALLEHLRPVVPLHRMPCVLEAAFVTFVADKVEPHEEFHEATMLLNGEVATDLIPHISLEGIEVNVSVGTLVKGLSRITEAEQRDFLLSNLFPDMPDGSRKRIAADPGLLREKAS